MASQTKALRREIWDLDRLKPYPLQADAFEDLSAFDLANLASDIKRKGLQRPIEILGKNNAALPVGTIISGHERKRALMMLGHEDAPVIIRDDLAEASKEEIEREFLEANLDRRQLHQLDKARSVVRLFEIQRQRRCGQLGEDEKKEARDRVGEAIGVSGRTLSRYMRVLQTPLAVQAAFRGGAIPLVVAEKVADFDDATQSKIAKRISAGEDAKTVVVERLRPKASSHQSHLKTFTKLMASLKTTVQHLSPELPEIPIEAIKPFRTTIEMSRRVLDTLAERLAVADRRGPAGHDDQAPNPNKGIRIRSAHDGDSSGSDAAADSAPPRKLKPKSSARIGKVATPFSL